ncbi:hypothetical protein [Nocardia xishanensis]
MPFVLLLAGVKHFGAHGFRRESVERAGVLDELGAQQEGTTS